MNKFSTSSFFIFIFSILSFGTYAAIPNGYYTSLNGKSTSELKTAACNVVNTLKVQDMNYYYNQLPIYFKTTDVRPNTSPQQWWDMYSGMVSYVKNGMSGLNREHSFPKSWWGGDDDTPAYTDLNHLYPSEAAANTAKNNYPLGEVAKTTFDNGYTKVGYAVSGQGGGSTYVFEPADEYKGDFARTYFYMSTCYQNLTWRYTYMVTSNVYPTLVPWAIDLLLKWSREDPVSQKEIDRNDAVYAAQGNRNPFIDFPTLAEYIWGNKKGQAFDTDTPPITGDPVLNYPVNGSSLDFSQTAINKSSTTTLQIKGENLTGNLTISIYGTNSSYFKANTYSIPASQVNSTDGYSLSLTYSPTTTGNHTANLAISDGGLTGSFAITLLGEAFPTPVLSTIVASPATDVTSTSYTANWNVPSGDVIDYYVVTRTVYENGNQTTTTYDAETNSYSFNDMKSGTTESYYVQSYRLGYLSSPSNVISVAPGSVTGVQTDQGLVAINGENGDILFRCSVPHTNCQIFDMQGRLIKVIPVLENETIINLPLGVYIVRTAELSTPIRIITK